MKTKSFYDLLRTKLSEEQLEEIDRQAQLEVAILKSIQHEPAKRLPKEE